MDAWTEITQMRIRDRLAEVRHEIVSAQAGRSTRDRMSATAEPILDPRQHGTTSLARRRVASGA